MNRSYDVIIKDGTIINGTMAVPTVADIGIQGDKIEKIGRITGQAARVIDAKDLIVAPGFIDVHTHCDSTFMRSGSLVERVRDIPSWKGNWNYLYQGVTTVVTGNCGEGYADADHWLDLVNSLGFGTNVYHLAPHGQIRNEVLGADQPKTPTGKQIDAMKDRVAEVMEMGAVGLSTGLVYAPGFLAQTEEIIELAKVAARFGGLYATHIRDESGLLYGDGKRGVCRAIEEALEVGEKAEIPVHISHLKISSPIDGMEARMILDIIEEARQKGFDVTADQYPYDAGSSHLTLLMPPDFLQAGGVKKQFKTKEGREQIKKAVKAVFSYLGPEKILISEYRNNREFEGKTLKEISEIEGRSPSESFVGMVTEERPPLAVFFSQDINIVRDILPNAYIMTGSDGWTTPKDILKPHPRCYGTFPKKIRKFVLEEKLQSLTAAIRSMSSLPAEKFNLKGRGKLEAGYFADIAVMDLDKITDHATYLDPHRYAEGIQSLLVNGVLVIDRGKATGVEAGRGLRRS
ncbi:MAG: amidohydrolase family protein [Deltaproteobacteria bacterium]|nr:amidohydrolase family protein [Deltaproteobacteria bacterium]